VKHVIRHELDAATARRVADHAADAYRVRYARYSPRIEWVTPSHCRIRFTVRGVPLAGELYLAPGAIEIKLDVPLVLRPFKGRAVAVIEEEIHRWLARARSGEV